MAVSHYLNSNLTSTVVAVALNLSRVVLPLNAFDWCLMKKSDLSDLN